MQQNKWRAKNKLEAGLVLDELAVRGGVVLLALDKEVDKHSYRRSVKLENVVGYLLNQKPVDLVE